MTLNLIGIIKLKMNGRKWLFLIEIIALSLDLIREVEFGSIIHH
jgi:hypothetical protein